MELHPRHRDLTGLDERVAELERSLRRTRITLRALVGALFFAASIGLTARDGTPLDEVRTRRLVVDDEGHKRVVLGQDLPSGQRRSRATGLTLFDAEGSERGGFSTMEDGSVIPFPGDSLDRTGGQEVADKLGHLGARRRQ